MAIGQMMINRWYLHNRYTGIICPFVCIPRALARVITDIDGIFGIIGGMHSGRAATVVGLPQFGAPITRPAVVDVSFCCFFFFHSSGGLVHHCGLWLQGYDDDDVCHNFESQRKADVVIWFGCFDF